MSNNTPDYDNLAFEPDLTWDKLVEWSKQYGFYVNIDEVLARYTDCGELLIHKDGRIELDTFDSIDLLAQRKLCQIKSFVKALYE